MQSGGFLCGLLDPLKIWVTIKEKCIKHYSGWLPTDAGFFSIPFLKSVTHILQSSISIDVNRTAYIFFTKDLLNVNNTNKSI